MLDIETQNLEQLGSISRPFSSQLGARTWKDALTEFIASKTAKIQAVISKKIKKESKNG